MSKDNYITIEQLNDLLEKIKNPVVGKAIMTTYHKLNNCGYRKVLCSISGGSDSDIVLDIVSFCDNKGIVDYVFFDTGLEYQATKNHIKFLEKKYNIVIKTIRPKIPIPLSCKKYGQPFMNKNVSNMIQRLQSHNFKWEDKSFDELIKEYPNCKCALKWWTNTNPSPAHNIKNNKYLKEFMIANPPNFKISDKCCKYAKKDLVHNEMKKGYDLDISGVRRAEGGVRATAYKSCFDNGDKYDKFRPIFWFKNEDKEYYKEFMGLDNSKCYTEYGLKRTGCCGCPFSKNIKFEINILKEYEPKLYNAVINVFKNSYEYTQQYKLFRLQKETKEA